MHQASISAMPKKNGWPSTGAKPYCIVVCGPAAPTRLYANPYIARIDVEQTHHPLKFNLQLLIDQQRYVFF